MIKNLIRTFCDLVYPPHCLICKSYIGQSFPKEVLCPQCREAVKPNIPPFCVKCSRFLGSHTGNSLCVECRRGKPSFDFAWACTLYEDPLKNLIHQFKYHQKTYLRHFFTELMLSFIQTYSFDIQQFDYLLPIPLYPSRFRERGYNQALLLAQGISRRHRIPILSRAIVRQKNTDPQITLNQKERWTNMKGAFRIKNPNIITNNNIILIDDLLTTGATASQAAETLKQAGAKTVGVLTLAVTVKS